MCKGMMELLEDTRAEGRAEGEAKERAKKQREIRRLVRFFRKSRMTESWIISSLTQGFSLKPDEAKSFL